MTWNSTKKRKQKTTKKSKLKQLSWSILRLVFTVFVSSLDSILPYFYNISWIGKTTFPSSGLFFVLLLWPLNGILWQKFSLLVSAMEVMGFLVFLIFFVESSTYFIATFLHLYHIFIIVCQKTGSQKCSFPLFTEKIMWKNIEITLVNISNWQCTKWFKKPSLVNNNINLLSI